MNERLAAGGERRVVVRVRYPETDRMGVAYHAHYLVWFELGRTELMREAGLPYGELEDRDGLFFPVVRVEARYRRPARYDEVLAVHTRVASIGAARVRFAYRVVREPEAEALAEGWTEHAAVRRDGRAVRIPAELRERLGPEVDEADGKGRATERP